MELEPKNGREAGDTDDGDCEVVLRRFINATIDAALHQRFQHGARGTLEEISVNLWVGALEADMRPLLQRQIQERGYVGECGTPPPGSPHEHSYYIKKRRPH